jgi:DNA-binding GntR family transcriptional regulator
MIKADSPNAEQNSEDAVYWQIREAIGGHKLPPGTRLREDEMRKIFVVSRDRIRKVFARLAHDGLVTIEPNRGASVARPSPKEARELFAARRGIEGAILAALAPRFGAAERRQLAAHIAEEHTADAARDYPRMIALSGEFHLKLSRLADNAPLEKFLRELVMRESLVIQAYERPGSPSCSADEHQSILDALVLKDTNAAMALMFEHLSNIEARLGLDRELRSAVTLSDVFS